MSIRNLLFLVLLAFVGTTSGCTQVYTQAPPSPVVNGKTAAAADLESKTVALVVVSGSAAKAYCSASWVGPQTILTAAHCVDDLEIGEEVTYVTRGDMDANDVSRMQRSHQAKIVRTDTAHDLALLQSTQSTAWHGIASPGDNPYVGENVQTMGHPLGLYWSYSTGVIASNRRLDLGDSLDPNMLWLQTTAPISPGNSGGGVYDANGDLLGVCSRSATRGQNINLYVHVQYVRAFLAGVS